MPSRLLPLTGSTDFKPVLISATTSGGANTITTAQAGTVGASFIDLQVSNTHTAAVTLNVGWGAVTDAGMLVKGLVVPPGSWNIPLTMVSLPLRNALVVKAWAGTASKLTITGSWRIFDTFSDIEDMVLGLLSGSTNGLPIQVAATSIAAGTTLHAVPNTTLTQDNLLLLFSNIDTSDRTLTLGWGGVTDPDNLVCSAYTIPASSFLFPVILPLRNNLIVKAAASVTNIINCVGKVLTQGVAA